MSEPSITAITPTLCRLLGIGPPELARSVPPLDEVVRAGNGLMPLEKCLVYAPDALGTILWERYPDQRQALAGQAAIVSPLHAVIPSKTPVCFASMFTGGLPAAHGIRQYEKPVLKCDTIFDALVRAGKRVAIVAVAGSSIDLIFRNRALEYFSETDDAAVTLRAEQLLASDRHDFLLLYHCEYDDRLHQTMPFSPQCEQAMRNHVASFERLSRAVDRHWARYRCALAFCPDHGAHIDAQSGRGTHGADIPEDVDLLHFFSLRAARS